MKPFIKLTALPSLVVLLIAIISIGWHSPEQKPKKKKVKEVQFIGDNLIVNPGCEELVGDFAKYWSPGADASFMRYNFVSNELTDHTSGPNLKDRGNNYFHISLEGVSQRLATQTIDLTPGSAAIDSGALTYTLGGWMGGMDDQPVTTLLHATFKDASGNTLLHIMTDTVGAKQRDNKPALLYRESVGTVPLQARSVLIGLETVLTDTSCTNCNVNGYADNLKFVLGRK